MEYKLKAKYCDIINKQYKESIIMSKKKAKPIYV